ncbi:MAG: hypothetical protein P8Y30_01830, partial [candidate division WOR-3 bacterium]
RVCRTRPHRESESQAAGKQKTSGKVTEEVSESEKKAKSEKTKEVSEKESRQKKIDDEINEFFKKEIQIDDFIKNNDNKKQK